MGPGRNNQKSEKKQKNQKNQIYINKGDGNRNGMLGKKKIFYYLYTMCSELKKYVLLKLLRK